MHLMESRRLFLQRTCLWGGLGLAGSALPAAIAAGRIQREKRKKIALLGTIVYKHSHTQHFLDRLALGYAWNGAWVDPRVELASVYIEQMPDGEKDLARQRIAKYGIPSFASVKEALTLGGSKLAVDGVVIIGEHGKYPKNEKGQTLYPRYRWFKECVKVFEESGRSVPVFNDKHLSTSWQESQEMVNDSQRLGFPLMAGSSLPWTRRVPELEMPWDAELGESCCVAYGGVDSYDFHALETAQCQSERRKGGETGVVSVQALKGEPLWNLLEQKERTITKSLFLSALCRSHNLPVDSGYPVARPSLDWARKALPSTIGFFIRHRDGLLTSAFLTGIRDFNYAGYLSREQRIVGCQFYLPMPGHGSTTADFFTPLIRGIEEMVLTGKSPAPIERTLLTTGLVIAGVESLANQQAVMETPHLNVAYRGPQESLFWRS